VAESETCNGRGPDSFEQFFSTPEKLARPRWVDLVESDEEHDCSNNCQVSCSSSTASSNRGHKNEKSLWADMADTDDENDMQAPSVGSPELRARNEKPSCGGNEQTNQDWFHDRVAHAKPATDLRTSSSRQPARGTQNNSVFMEGAHKGSAKSASRAGKGSGKGAGKISKAGVSGGKGGGKGARNKLQCQFIIGIEEEPKFKVMRQIIGSGGANMKRIALSTDAKLRLRGRGSGFLEGPLNQESTDDLMLCLSSQDAVGYENAKRLVAELLRDIYKNYDKFCSKAGQNPPGLSIQIHEGYREGSR